MKMAICKLSTYSCVRIFFCAFNVLFWLLGCALISLGLWLVIVTGAFSAMTPRYHIVSATVLCVIAGVVLVVVSFCGCCGSLMQSRCLLLTYFVLVVVFLGLEVIASFMAFIYRRDMAESLRAELLTSVRLHYATAAMEVDDASGLRQSWDTLQSNMQCCGVYNATDWYHISAWPDEKRVPDSCCTIPAVDCGRTARWRDLHQKGCLPDLSHWIRSHLYIIAVLGITVAVLQMLGIAASLTLVNSMRKGAHHYYS